MSEIVVLSDSEDEFDFPDLSQDQLNKAAEIEATQLISSSSPTKPSPSQSSAQRNGSLPEIPSQVPFSQPPAPVTGSCKEIPASATFRAAVKKLNEVFGFPNFRPAQTNIVKRLLRDDLDMSVDLKTDEGRKIAYRARSTVAVMPTGGGKSLLYQLPALVLPHVTIVISPLIALMKDQVDVLRSRGICAASLDSTQSYDTTLQTRKDLATGRLKLLFVSPERLNNEGFIAMISEVEISLLAIDESHAISEWGQSFRPDYLKVARFAQECQAERVLCLTATAKHQVRKDICRMFDIPEEGLFITPSFRSNLHLHVESVGNDDDGKIRSAKLIALLKSGMHPGATIVYVTTQNQSVEVASSLVKAGLSAKYYHAGMPAADREVCQDWFMSQDKVGEPVKIMVATIAFGMGLDKNDVRNVIHYNLPKSIEGYSQEVGRAGRDGKPSYCLLYLSASDVGILEGFIRGDTPSESAVDHFLREIFSDENRQKPVWDILEFNHYDQEKDYDIKRGVLNLLYAHLELREEFQWIRATTPRYSIYTYKDVQPFTDSTKIGQAILSHTKKGVNWRTVDMDALLALGHDRTALLTCLQRWEGSGFIKLKPSQVRNRYVIMKQMPTLDEVGEAAKYLFTLLNTNEERDMSRLHQVITMASAPQCIACTLSNYFGENIDPCGKCSVCKGHVATWVPRPKISAEGGGVDKKKWEFVLSQIPIRDDPRSLARAAFGIGSPRITALKLPKQGANVAFGSMEDHSWEDVMTAAKEACADAEYINKEYTVPGTALKTHPPKPTGKSTIRMNTSTKRSYPSSSNESSPGYSKRGRSG